jgi:hypothetical protein
MNSKGKLSRAGLHKIYFHTEVWAKMDKDAKEAYESAALEAHHVKLGMPSKRSSSEDQEDGDEEGEEGGSGSSSRVRKVRRGGGRKPTTDLAKCSLAGISITGQFQQGKKWMIELADGRVIKVGKLFANKSKALAIKKAAGIKKKT